MSGRETSVEQDNDLAVSSSEPEMESVRSTSATPRPSLAESDAGDGRPRKLNWDKLRSRNVDEEPSDDERLSQYQGLLDLKLTKLETPQAKEVQAIFKRFAQLRVEEIDYPRVESVSNEFDQWKSKVGLARISEEHFLSDIKRCSFSNEAILQRTIMIEVIDRHQLHDILTFNSEGQWKQVSSGCLISKNCDSVTLPKPDLNISFKLESFDKSAPIPGSLRYSFRPDSDGKRYGRCFPFLFFEVKKAHHDLEVALMANLHSASQALLNIYAWMVNTEQAEAFFEKVRVFSFIFNVQDLSVRMHRATRHPRTLLQYHFTEVADLRRYSKDEACLLVRKILESYAIKELHPILKSAFDTVTAKHEEEIQKKRKADLEQKATKRPRNRQTPSLPLDATSSFGLSTLQT